MENATRWNSHFPGGIRPKPLNVVAWLRDEGGLGIEADPEELGFQVLSPVDVYCLTMTIWPLAQYTYNMWLHLQEKWIEPLRLSGSWKPQSSRSSEAREP